MNRSTATRFLSCFSLAFAVAACGDDGGDGMPDAARPDAMQGMPDAAPPDAPPTTPELVVSSTTLTVNEGSAEGATVTVKLSAAPGAALTVMAASSDTAAVAVAPASLSFDASSYATEQTLTVTAVDDADTDNETVTLTLSATGLDDVTVEVTVVDDDALNIVAEPTTVTVTEGEVASFDVTLSVQPDAEVTVSVVSGDEGAVTVDRATLTFTPDDFDDPQTITVTGVADDDASNESVSVTLSANGLADVTVTVTVTDNTEPFAVPMFVRFTGPDVQDVPLVYQGGNRYSAVVSLGAPTIQNFWIAEAGSSPTIAFSRSATEPQFINLDQPTPLVATTDVNAQTLLVIMTADDYQFDLDATSATSPVLTVTAAP